MNADVLPSRDDIDQIELPLRLATADVEALGRILDRIRATRAKPALPSPDFSDSLLALAESIYRFRRVRDEVFGEGSFSDPRWDMLLDLFISAEKGRRVSVSSACIGAAAPATTALRHLSALVKEGLVERRRHEADARVVNVELTAEGWEKVRRVLLAWMPSGSISIGA